MAKCENLILFSDIEGCLSFSNSIKQHTLLCDSATFNAIYAFLETSTNHVAFCGDYFDAGPKIAESIIGIAWLKDSYPTQVHIILGNRDINKMRLKYEKILVGNASHEEVVKMSGAVIYDTWKTAWLTEVITEVNKAKRGEPVQYPADPTARVEHLLVKTFGAPNLLSNLVQELNKDQSIEFTKANALALFDKIFTGDTHRSLIPTGTNIQPAINVETFVTACKNIFFYGKLIEIITVGEKKVLLSHAGSSHIAIYTAEYSTALDNAMIQSASTQRSLGDYFVALETYRADLECNDEGITTKGESKYDVNSVSQIGEVITKINSLKEKAYIDILGVQSPSVNVSEAWLLVQAMGIPAIGKAKVASPIQSCILTPMCMTRIEELSPKITDYFSSSKVDIIAHGHVPSCVTVPIIARFTSHPPLVFVALDQSNGNRPSVPDPTGNPMTLQNVPIACIANKTIGIVSLNANGTLNNAETSSEEGYLIYAHQNGLEENDPNYYRDLVKTFNYDDTIPTIITINNYINTSNPTKFQPMLRCDTTYKDMIRTNTVRRDSDTKEDITRERDRPNEKGEEGKKGKKGKKGEEGEEDEDGKEDEEGKEYDMVDGGNKNKSKNKRLRKCRKCLMCCNGSCDYSAKLNNTKRGSRKRKKARKTIKKSNNSKQRTRKQKKARKHKK